MWLDFTYALSLQVQHRSQTTRLHPALPCAAISIFFRLYLKTVVHITCSRYLFHIFPGQTLSLQRYSEADVMLLQKYANNDDDDDCCWSSTIQCYTTWNAIRVPESWETTTCLKKTCHLIVTIISSNLNRFSKSFHSWKSVKFTTKQYITLPTTPKICCHTTSRNCDIWITSLQMSPQCL